MKQVMTEISVDQYSVDKHYDLIIIGSGSGNSMPGPK